jgi:two-component system sensor histidine kinase KdpD
VSVFVALAARRGAECARARSEIEALGRLAGAAPVPALLESLRGIVGFDSAAVLHRDGDTWRVEASSGAPVPPRPEGDTVIALDPAHVLVLDGGAVDAADQHVLDAFTAELTSAIEIQELESVASEAASLAATSEFRTAILSAVSHDLRTPLAGIKASATSLLQEDVDWTPEQRRELLAAIDEETDRLDALVGNLLDMSRLQTGALDVYTTPVGLEEVVPAALTSIGATAREVRFDVPETLPRVVADPGLLERALANVVTNAIRFAPADTPVRIVAGKVDGGVDVRVVDCGSGVPQVDRERIFQPFQRLGDAPAGAGVGLGLAVAKGFVEAMGGSIEAEDTPGGGLTMVMRLKAEQ